LFLDGRLDGLSSQNEGRGRSSRALPFVLVRIAVLREILQCSLHQLRIDGSG
jgi:hypothetical protein